MSEQQRVFRISSDNKGLWCPFKPIVCQEGYCQECQIYLDWQEAAKPEGCPMLDECYKVKMILDKEMLYFQYADAIRKVCAKCTEVPHR